MTIHGEHPFLPPEQERSPVRRFRGRLPSPVTLWTSTYDGDRAGLTVSSMLVADGDPGLVIGIVDPDSDLWDAIRRSRRAVVSILAGAQLADAFGYVAPAPGGPFRLGSWLDTEWGPALEGATWAGCMLLDPVADAGWGLEVRMEIAEVSLAEDGPVLAHRRGRYHGVE